MVHTKSDVSLRMSDVFRYIRRDGSTARWYITAEALVAGYDELQSFWSDEVFRDGFQMILFLMADKDADSLASWFEDRSTGKGINRILKALEQIAGSDQPIIEAQRDLLMILNAYND